MQFFVTLVYSTKIISFIIGFTDFGIYKSDALHEYTSCHTGPSWAETCKNNKNSRIEQYYYKSILMFCQVII